MFSQKGKINYGPSNASSKPEGSRTIAKEGRAVEFRLSNLRAQSVGVGGTFNQWNPLSFGLTRDGQWNWKGSLLLKPGRYQYRFFVDGKWADDPNAKETVANVFGSKNAVLTVK
ncbi:MAG TPA: hypothetical protein PKL97_02625 [Candidatus Omnitrophota bacterium]|nr:hypothetical protein [Candidatus Omnitrophota bacterium]